MYGKRLREVRTFALGNQIQLRFHRRLVLCPWCSGIENNICKHLQSFICCCSFISIFVLLNVWNLLCWFLDQVWWMSLCPVEECKLHKNWDAVSGDVKTVEQPLRVHHLFPTPPYEKELHIASPHYLYLTACEKNSIMLFYLAHMGRLSIQWNWWFYQNLLNLRIWKLIYNSI